MNITQLKVGQRAIVTRVHGDSLIALRLQELGLTPGTTITLQRTAPLGDPVLLHLRGYTLALRKAQAMLIFVKGELS